MNKFQFNKKTDNLFKAILSLKNIKEAQGFFRDLCTAEEINEMALRWEIAQMVFAGLPYRKIADRLDVSTTTVSRVASWLNNGEGGYQLILDRLNHYDSSRVFRKS